MRLFYPLVSVLIIRFKIKRLPTGEGVYCQSLLMSAIRQPGVSVVVFRQSEDTSSGIKASYPDDFIVHVLVRAHTCMCVL